MIYLGYAKSGREFEVTQDLADIGIDAWCGRAIEWRRTGKKRYPEPHETPALPNYLFIEMTAHQFLEALKVKYLASTLTALSEGDTRGYMAFRRMVEAEFTKQDKMRQRQEIPKTVFNAGQQLDIIGGYFAERLGTFRRLVENTHEFHPKLEVYINGLPVQLDPLDVKAAE